MKIPTVRMQVAIKNVCLFFLFINIIPPNPAIAQNPDKVDSLILKLSSSKGREKAETLNHLGREYLYLDLQKSKEYLEQALHKAKAENWEGITATSYQNLGAFYLSSGFYDSALISYNLALAYFEDQGDEQQVARIHHEQGILHFRKGEYSEALIIYKKALSSYQNLAFTVGTSTISTSIGDVYRYLGDYARAMEYYLQALKLAEELEDIPRQAGSLNSVGLIHFREKNYDKALGFFERGLALSEELGYDVYIAACVANIADIHSERGDHEKALQFHLRSLELDKKQQNLDGQAQSLSSVGRVYEAMKDYDKAISNFEASLSIADSIGAARSVALNCNNLSRVHRTENRLQTSLQYAQRALVSAIKQDFQEQISASHLNLAKTYSAMNNYEAAYENHMAYAAVKDSVYNGNRIKQIAEMQTKYETEKKEQKIASLQIETRNETFKRNAYALGFIGTFVIAGLVIGWLNYRIRKTKSIREKENLLNREKIRSYEKELIQFTQNTIEKTNRIESLNLELEKVKKEIASNCQQYSGHLDKLMQSTILTEKEWKEFKTLFDQVHPIFFGNLRTMYPDLSASEIRMAALVKLNLTSKEISNMLGISHESVNKSRYRLRKKLNLTKEERLEKHFENL